MATNDELMRILGRVENKVDGMAERLDRFEIELSEDRKATSESRGRMYERIEETSARVVEVEKTVIVAGGVVAQQRDVISGLKKTFDEEVKPTLAEWTRLKTLGWGMRVVLVSAGVSIGVFGAAFLWFGETIGPIIRRMLKAG